MGITSFSSYFDHTWTAFRGRAWVHVFWVLALMLVTLVGDRASGAMLNHVLLSSQARYSLLYRGGMDKDIVFIGNSRGLHSFYVPAIEAETALSAFNLSYNSLSTPVATVLLGDYLKRNEAPRLIVIEVSMLAQEKSTMANFTPYTQQSAALARLLRKSSPGNAIACQLSHLYCFNSELFQRVLYYLNKSDQSWVNRYDISPDLINLIETEEVTELEYASENIVLLRQFVAKAEAQGIEVRLIVAPYFPAYGIRIANLEQWVTRVESTLGHDVINYAFAVRDQTGFADRLHLNEEGSRLFLHQMLADGLFNLESVAEHQQTNVY